MTQFGRALNEVSIEILCANTSQAKGRVERANRTLQDRLVKELRLAGISDMEAANAFRPGFMAQYNVQLAKVPRRNDDLHRPMDFEPGRLQDVFCLRYERYVGTQPAFFTSRGAELPLLTRSLIAVSDFINAWGLVTLAAIVIGIFSLGAVLRRPSVRLRWHRLLARAPVTRTFVLKANAAQFAGTLSTLTVSQVPLTDALEAAAQTVPNLYIRARVQAASARVREGTALSRALMEADIFPPMLIAMVASGEAGGVLGATLTRAAEDQARDLNALVAALVALVEPAVLLLMGGIVMLLVLSILLPIVNLNNLVN